nr:MAG TPA: Helix-turn-helix XRE-family like protein [Caudoviricetes sp.]
MRRNLQKAREQKGLTQSNVAEILGMSVRQYQRLESGDSNGVFRHWDALEDLLGVHQRILREIADIRPGPAENQRAHESNPRE